MTIKDVAEHLQVGWDTIKDIQAKNLQRRFGKPKLHKLLDARLDRAREVAKTNKPDALAHPLRAADALRRTLYGKDRDMRDRMEQDKKLIEELGGT